MKIRAGSAIPAIVAVALAVYICVTTLVGVFNHFLSIPTQDQWDGVIGFDQSIRRGDWKVFWELHVNHRIVIPRLIFLADIRWFGGWSIFTTVVGLCFAALTTVVIAARIELSGARWVVAAAATVGMVFSWCNGDNYTFPFNVQNTGVILFAIWASAEFTRAGNRSARVRTALLLAVLAELCAANGVFVFPVLVLQALILRRPRKEIVTVVVVGAIAVAAYMYKYVMPVYPVDPEVAQIRFASLRFALLLAGSPFIRVVNDFNACEVVGALALIAGIGACARTVFGQEVTRYRAFLIGGAAFCVVSILAAANGRWVLGLASAFSGRYVILPLLYYLFTVLLIVDLVKEKTSLRFIGYAPLVLLLIFAPVQREAAFKPNLFNARLAVLGPKIELDQPNFDNYVYPTSMHTLYMEFTRYASTENIGPYSAGWLHDAGVVRYDPLRRDDSLCSGTFESAIQAESGHQVFGWVAPKKSRQDAVLVVVTDSSGRTIGYGVSGMSRADVAQHIAGAPLDAGWSGFTGKADFGPAYAYLDGKFCLLAKVPDFTQ
ncbi:hypothetical protein SAMN05443245_0929 [Paraburkholderia fungorum]|uniref:Glucosyl transferase GtrII n=1 Tax=Paraburkholderia fungorum TaxID=134537 RepID=A0A1H0ZZ72_9BURK|nr:hypothetical protein [Paraburkholderia fungorum]SDQ32690.1 hypothetical protein SAMN05443245_0929 [Paraburkholderia fungorum]